MIHFQRQDPEAFLQNIQRTFFCKGTAPDLFPGSILHPHEFPDYIAAALARGIESIAIAGFLPSGLRQN
ncbi:MAG: hypothetical protein O2807_01140 [bacterium]|nr:hypothetical protein [bacterium]